MSAAGTMAWGSFTGVKLAGAGCSRRVAAVQPRVTADSSRPETAPVQAPAKILTGEKRVDADWQAVVRRCLNGDSLAWVELVRTHHGRVYGLCYRFTGSPHDAEDLTQDVFLKVYGNLHAFDGARGSFQTWLTTMTRNLLVDHFRRSKQQRVTESIDAGWDENDGRAGVDRLGIYLEDRSRSPHEHALQRELETMVQQALTKVSPELREAVILRDLQDMDYKDIALVLHVPEGTVKSRISRGRAELARLLHRDQKQVS